MIVKNNIYAALGGKYAKRALTLLEQQGTLTAAQRKIILDVVNDLCREIELEIVQQQQRESASYIR